VRGTTRCHTRRRGGASLRATAPSSLAGATSLAAVGSSCCILHCLLKLWGGDGLALPVLWGGSRREVAKDGGTGLPRCSPWVDSCNPVPRQSGLASSVHARSHARPQWRQPRSAISLASPGRLPMRGVYILPCVLEHHTVQIPATGGGARRGVHHSTSHFNPHYTRSGPRMTDGTHPLGKMVNAGATFGHVSRLHAPTTGRARPGVGGAALAGSVPPRRRPSPPCAGQPPG
jgi:hypothetical protein